MKSNNKMIAMFMGYIDNGCSEDGYLINPITNYDEEISSLKYDFSWDSLISVVHKIYEMGIEAEEVLIIRDALAEASFILTYQAVVDFINWYNQHK